MSAGPEDDYTAHLRTSSYAMLKAEAGPQSLVAGLHQPRAFPLSSTTPASLFQSLPYIGAQQVSKQSPGKLELETKVSIVSHSHPYLMIIASASQFHVYLPRGQRPFSIVSYEPSDGPFQALG